MISLFRSRCVLVSKSGLWVAAFAATWLLALAARAQDLPAPAPITNSDTSVACVIDGVDDASVAAPGRLLERGVWVRVAGQAARRSPCGWP